MSEDFVSFKIAKKLKEKGFNKPCVATYDKDGMLGYNYVQPTSIRAVGFDECLVYHNDCVMAPTISQVLKWLREEKAISVEPLATPYNCWFYMIKCKGEIKVTYTGNKYKTYEAAAIAGIEYVPHYLM